MREIKFRAWNPPVDHGPFGIKGGYMAYQGTADIETIGSFFHHYADEILMQFTGLRDMNGREIYEGDLIRCHLHDKRIGAIDQIVYSDSSGAFEFKRRLTTIKAFLEHDGMFDTEIEVIGNIYENKELENV